VPVPCQKVFVYGSLKRGFSNHGCLRGQQFLGPARTERRYRMYDYGGFPAVVETGPETGLAIEGELWEVDADCLVTLDWLEEVEDGLYRRAEARLAEPAAATGVLIYLYNRPIADLPDVGTSWPRALDRG